MLGVHCPNAQQPVVYLPETAAAHVLCRMRCHCDATVRVAPPVTLAAHKRANVSLVVPVPYLQDYEVECGMGGCYIAGPIHETLHEGLSLGLTSSLHANRMFLDIDGVWTSVPRPLPTFTTELAGEVRTIQLPATASTRLRTTVELWPCETALLSLGVYTNECGAVCQRVVFVRARSLEAAR